jgi:hypothetical protein
MSDLPVTVNPADGSEFLLYQTEDGRTRVQVRVLDETVWLSQRQMAELFQKDVRTINEHIQNVYDEDELNRTVTIRNFRTVQQEGARQVERDVDFYNLDVVISVGYRVRSLQGTRFRQWATQRLREYIIKGFVMDDERLKAGRQGEDYFDELLEPPRLRLLILRPINNQGGDLALGQLAALDVGAKDEGPGRVVLVVRRPFLLVHPMTVVIPPGACSGTHPAASSATSVIERAGLDRAAERAEA